MQLPIDHTLPQKAAQSHRIISIYIILNLPSININNFTSSLKPNILLYLIINRISPQPMQTLSSINTHRLDFDEVLILGWGYLSLIDEHVIRGTWFIVDEFCGEGG